MTQPKLHELLAAEKTQQSQINTLIEDTMRKFKSPENFFSGHSRTLKMIADSPENKALEDAARKDKALPTNVHDTLEYVMAAWVRAEDLQYQKNRTNQNARGNVEFRGSVILQDIPVDSLMGLESRLGVLKQVLITMPTLDATKHWELDTAAGAHVWRTKYPDVTSKTEKIMVPVVLAPATEKHPAQVKESTKDVPVGNFTDISWSGAATAHQKAEVLTVIDELVGEVKKARMRANSIDAVTDRVASAIAGVIMNALK